MEIGIEKISIKGDAKQLAIFIAAIVGGIYLLIFHVAPPLQPMVSNIWENFVTGAINTTIISGSLSNGCATPIPTGSCGYANDSAIEIIFPDSSSVNNWLNITMSGGINQQWGSSGSYLINFTLFNGSSSITGSVSGSCSNGAGTCTGSSTKLFNFTTASFGAPKTITDGISTLTFTTTNTILYMHIQGDASNSDPYYTASANVNLAYTYINGTTEPSTPIMISSTILPIPVRSTDTLLGYCNATVEYGNNVTYNYTFYKNGIFNTSGSVGPFIPGVDTNVANISPMLLVFGDKWILECLANTTNGSSSSLNSSEIIIFGGIIANYSVGINGLSFRPLHAYSQNVQPVNQTNILPLYVTNNTVSYTMQIMGKISSDIPGFSIKCIDDYAVSSAIPITSTWTNISQLLPYDPNQSSCYQETATVRGICGASPYGLYSLNGNWQDGNWTTATTLDNGAVYVNYSISSFANNATMQIKFGNTTATNTSILEAFLCMNNSSTAQFRLQYYNQSLGDGSDGTFIFNNGSAGIAGICYQETANVSSSCGGLATGGYSSIGCMDFSTCGGGEGFPFNAVDGNWGTSSSPFTAAPYPLVATLYVNYTKPSNALNSSVWQIADFSINEDEVPVNFTIPDGCWNVQPLQFAINYSGGNGAGSNYVQFKCYNATNWFMISDNGFHAGFLYEEAMWWNMTGNSFGNLINGTDYNISAETLYFNLNRPYHFTNFTLGANTFLTTSNTNGTVLLITAQDTINISGTINLTGKGTPTSAPYTYGFRIFTPKTQGAYGTGGNGGYGYLNSWYVVGIYGGVGTGVAGTGGASNYSAGVDIRENLGANPGGPSAGGSGAMTNAYGAYDGSWVQTGAGGNAFGGNGGSGSAGGGRFGYYSKYGGGGGGGGGIPGTSGAALYLLSDIVFIDGTLSTTGTAGSGGGAGGTSAGNNMFGFVGATGGNGGEGGKGGDITIDSRNLNILTATINTSGELGGIGGAGGYTVPTTCDYLPPGHTCANGTVGVTGTTGTTGTNGQIQLGSSAYCYYNSTWNSLLQIPQDQQMSSLYEEGVNWTIATQDGIGELWCWADFNNPFPLKQNFNVSIDGVAFS